MTFYSLGLCLFTGKKVYTIFPFNILLYPLIRLFNLEIPILMIDEVTA